MPLDFTKDIYLVSEKVDSYCKLIIKINKRDGKIVKDYFKLGVLNKNIGKLGIFIVERERDVVWNEEVGLTLILRNYSNITIEELIIENFWREWGILFKDKVKSNNKVVTIGENDNIILNKLNQQEICIVEFKFKILEKASIYIKRKIKTYFKYANEMAEQYHKVESDYVRFKIYERLIKNVDIEKEILADTQMPTIYTPLNYDVKFDINSIQTNEGNNKEKLTSNIVGSVFINVYYKSDSGKFDNLEDKVQFCINVDDLKLKIEEVYIATQKLLIKIIDSKKILTTTNFNIYKINS